MYIRKHPVRFAFVFFSLIACLIVFTVKLVLIQVFRSSYLAHLAQRQHHYLIELEPKRGGIYDRKERPLALNVTAYSLSSVLAGVTDACGHTCADAAAVASR